MPLGSPKPSLTILLRGGVSMPLREVAEHIERVLVAEGLQVIIEAPAAQNGRDNWNYGLDGLLEDETVLVQTEEP